VILALAAQGAPAWQQRALRVTLPAVRAFMLRAMAIDARTVAESRTVVAQHFDRIAARLRDGRPYLLGDRFSAADLTFAALGALMVVPPEHPVRLPTERFPETAHALWREMRTHPACALILRLYATHRAPLTTADTTRDRVAGSLPR